MSIALVFPGQGEQKPGMGRDIYEAYPDKRYIFHKAREIVGEDIKNICFNKNGKELEDARISGLAVFIVSALIYEILKDYISPLAYAGYSVGQYSALYASGAFSFESSLSLLNFRGRCLQKGAVENRTGMFGVIGLNVETINEITKKTGKAYIANYNSPGNYSVSYHDSVKDGLLWELEKADAMKVVNLPVAGGWHCPFMKSAADMFKPELLAQPVKPPHKGFIDNYTAETVNSVDELQNSLYHHVYSPVKWHHSVKKMIDMGADTFIEIGFGNQLSKFIKFTNRKVKVFYTGTLSDLEKTIEASIRKKGDSRHESGC